jgi:hypothetical protein
MCFRPSLKFKLVWLGLVLIHVDNYHRIQHQIYHPMNITQTQQIFRGGKKYCKSLAYKHYLVFHTLSQNYKDLSWLGKILGNNIEWTLFYATKSHQLLVVVFLAIVEDDGCKCLFHETRQMLECLLALRFSNLNIDPRHIVGSRALCKNNLGYCSNL